MTQSTDARSGLLGGLIGALIVLVVGGGILFAMGAFEPAPTRITIQQPSPPAASDIDSDRDRDGRRGERRDDRADWRDRDRRDDDSNRGPDRR